MQQKEETKFLAFLGIYDYEEKGVEVDLNHISDDMYENIYYMLCRDIETGDIIIFLKNKNGKNEIKEVIEDQAKTIFVHPLNQVFSLGEFVTLFNFYQQNKELGICPTMSEIQEQVEKLTLTKNKVKRYRK